MSLTIIRERANLNIQSDQWNSDQVIKSESPLCRGWVKSLSELADLRDLGRGSFRKDFNSDQEPASYRA